MVEWRRNWRRNRGARPVTGIETGRFLHLYGNEVLPKLGDASARLQMNVTVGAPIEAEHRGIGIAADLSQSLVDQIEHGSTAIIRGYRSADNARCLSVARSSVYWLPRPANDDNLQMMRLIDELFTAWPFLGSRRLAVMLREKGYSINRKRVQRLMRKMGIAALGPKPRTTKPAPGHKIFPYLLRDLAIDRPNQVWAADISAP